MVRSVPAVRAFGNVDVIGKPDATTFMWMGSGIGLLLLVLGIILCSHRMYSFVSVWVN
ncbi:hypothetical protein HanXRQr2_Chr08g0332521 [Helianthus annuus]|uniref:Uncharacterized protein n=1 Tax=Helianthus annuus TaxID=4232 RepID=A0A9K3NCV5_HELAN|nr:hypothetical protein HanXRQr2_Chr08g0332521 [Helianthus annuus]KAJ0718744.1 hypothetical protein HanLR1_Chr08g0273981 [Helianthus annuus]